MKKKLLFVIDSLHCAGAEKSLVTLLSLLDYDQYEVDLQLFGYGGVLEEMIPKEVNLLPPLEYFNFADLGIREALTLNKFRLGSARLRYSLALRIKKYNNAQKARVFWQSVSSVIENSPKMYDIAISYAQGVPTFYVVDKVQAKKKYAWVNVSYRLEGKDKKFQTQYYEKYNKIVAVSDSAQEIFSEVFPQYSSKIEVIYDINDANLICKMANSGQSYQDNFTGIRMLTIGRLAHQKGYDIALEACRILRDEGVSFRWYALGVGPLENEIRKLINDYQLEDYFILLGVKSNPYPYIKDCDIYVQTSKFEGFGLAIAEARMLNKPIVTTRFDAVYNQMIHGKNGLVVDMNGKSVAEGIKKMILDSQFRNSITSYLEHEKKGNVEELDKVTVLLNEVG